MKVYRLRRKSDKLFYKGKGYFDNGEGRIYSSKGHIKNSLKQADPSGIRIPRSGVEIVTYEMTEEKKEDL